MIIDVHSHALHEKFLRRLVDKRFHGLTAEHDGKHFIIQREGGRRGFPGPLDPFVHNIAARLESLERRGVDLQLVGPQADFLAWPGGAVGVEAARMLNEQTAQVVADGAGKLQGMTAVALGDPKAAAEELRKAVETYQFTAAIIPSSAGGVPLDGPQFEPVIEVFEQLGLLVFLHPIRIDFPEQLARYHLYTLVRFPYETTIAVTRFIFTGLLERHPALKLLLAHGGGTLPFLRGRLDTAYDAKGWEADPTIRQHISKPPSRFFDQLFFDTCVLSPDSLQFLLSVVGVDRVMFGTDYPFDIGDPDGRHAMPAINKLSAGERTKVLGANAAAVLNAAIQNPH